MKLATWNVNSLKVRLPHLLDWLAAQSPDCICIQETKTEDATFPRAAIEAAGYSVAFAGQKTYNGVALVTRKPVSDVVINIPALEDDQKRVISATLDGVRIVCAYVPNGQSIDSDKYQYKLKWLGVFEHWLEGELTKFPKLAVLGDYNIAPEDRDVHNPKRWVGQVLVSEPERDAFKRLLGLGFTDSFRLFDQPEKSFTWWDYRLNGFARNWGLRIDHILASKPLADSCKACSIDLTPRQLERPSDHTPVVAEFDA